jgi:hypothetical protein
MDFRLPVIRNQQVTSSSLVAASNRIACSLLASRPAGGYYRAV